MKPEGISEVTSAALALTIKNITELTGPIYSTETTVRGLPWRIYVKPVENKVTRTTSLGVFLECTWKQNSDDRWKCSVEMVMRLLARKKNCTDFEMESTTHAFSAKKNDWGYRDFIPWTTLVSTENGFLKNNSVILEVDMWAERPEGIRSPKRGNGVTLESFPNWRNCQPVAGTSKDAKKSSGNRQKQDEGESEGSESDSEESDSDSHDSRSDSEESVSDSEESVSDSEGSESGSEDSESEWDPAREVRAPGVPVHENSSSNSRHTCQIV